MSRVEFLAQLRRALGGLPQKEIEDIVADYAAHFDEALAAGRSEADVARALGDPNRLARELRAEAGLRRWETQRTPTALITAIAALGGMLALDVFVLLPLLFVFGLIAFIVGVLLFALGVAGFGVLLSGLLHLITFSGLTASLSRTLTGIGLLGASVGFTALLWLVLEGLVRLLGSYARLHYRALKPAGSAA
jgi:uncharacterized membrane protein